MSFRDYIEIKKQLSIRRMNTIETFSEAVDYPCQCCKGQGLIVQVCNYNRVDGEVIKGNSGEPISSSEIIICPQCSGHGIDPKKIG